MRKVIFIMALCTSLGACATGSDARSGDGNLLSFDELANEITVGFEERSNAQVASTSVEGPLGTP